MLACEIKYMKFCSIKIIGINAPSTFINSMKIKLVH